MTTVILVGLIVVLLAAAAYVGVLLVRRTRSAPAEAEPGGRRPSARARWRTWSSGAPVDEPADDPAAELSGDELFVPAGSAAGRGRRAGRPAPVPAEPAAARSAVPQPATPAGGLEIGDAPWRRAARMTGAEPGGAWETAPFPVVASATGAPTPGRVRRPSARSCPGRAPRLRGRSPGRRWSFRPSRAVAAGRAGAGAADRHPAGAGGRAGAGARPARVALDRARRRHGGRGRPRPAAASPSAPSRPTAQERGRRERAGRRRAS